MRRLLYISGFLFVSLIVSISYAQPAVNDTGVDLIMDFDSTAVAGQEGRSPMTRGSWNTPFVLRRVFFRGNMYQPVAEGDGELIISQKDFYELHVFNDRLARGELKPGNSVGQKVLVTDMKTGKKVSIRPSEYTLAYDWFRFYRADPTGEHNYLSEDFQKAKGGKWKGPMYPLLSAALSTPETAKAVIVQSARLFPDDQWQGLFSDMAEATKNDELPIRNSPNDFVSTSGPETEKYSSNPQSASQSKPGWLEEYIRMRIKSDVSQAPVILSPNGDSMKQSYFLIFADDRPETIEFMHRLLQKYATDVYGRNIKFGLYAAMSDADVKRTGRPRFCIYKNDGTVRPATEDERVGEALQLKADPKVIEAAKKAFAKMEKAFKPKLKEVPMAAVETKTEKVSAKSCKALGDGK